MLGSSSNQLIVSVFVIVVTLVACGGPAEERSPASQGSNAPGSIEAPEAAPPTAAGDPASAAPLSSKAHELLGQPLTDPPRFYGLYANPDTPNRQWFVTEAKRPEYAEQAPEVPPGYLMIGAMFADVAPWQMKTLSETEFEQAWVPDYQPEPAAVVFELGDDGRAVAMKFTDPQNAAQGRLERQGDLPQDWQ